MTTYVIVGGSNYSGGWRVYQSREDAGQFVDLAYQIFPYARMTQLFDRSYTRANILETVNLVADQVTSSDTVIMYFAGHGTQVPDRDGDEVDGRDEALHTDDRRTVTDDELTMPFARAWQTRNATPKIISIADTCHSPSFDMNRFAGTGIRAVSIKAALDHESALQSGDGSYMSSMLFPILSSNPQICVGALKTRLMCQMFEGFAGSLQSCQVDVSRLEMWQEPLF